MKKTLKEEIDEIKSKMNLKSKNNNKHEYGCVMIFYHFPEMKEIHNEISPNDIYTDPNDDSYGLENEPHVTLLYGLHKGVSTNDVENVLDKHTYDSIKLHNLSIFSNEKYDVLKFDVQGNELKETNDELKDFPYTNDYPDYHPHMTIGYLKPGTGKKYLKRFENKIFWVAPLYGVYSKIDGNKDKINIRID